MNSYSYIGSFELSSKVLDIADPYINSMARAIEKIPPLNETSIKVRMMVAGNYSAYHVIDLDTDEIIGLLVIHSQYDVEDALNEKNVENLGFASSGLSSAVVLVDEMYRFDTRYCYNPIEKDAYYDGRLVLEKLKKMPYDDEVKARLYEKINKILKDDELMHPKGEDILNILGNLPIWEGFRDFKLCSSHWSVDVMNRLESKTNGAVIMGGVVSTSPGGFLTCYALRNHRNDTYAIYVSLRKGYGAHTNVYDKTNMPLFDLIEN